MMIAALPSGVQSLIPSSLSSNVKCSARPTRVASGAMSATYVVLDPVVRMNAKSLPLGVALALETEAPTTFVSRRAASVTLPEWISKRASQYAHDVSRDHAVVPGEQSA